jgi:hypothetical protein
MRHLITTLRLEAVCKPPQVLRLRPLDTNRKSADRMNNKAVINTVNLFTAMQVVVVVHWSQNLLND